MMVKPTVKELLEKVDNRFELVAVTAKRARQIANGDKVPLVGFGTFAVSERAAREGRNPRTGETVTIAARNAVTFKAGSALKDAVN